MDTSSAAPPHPPRAAQKPSFSRRAKTKPGPEKTAQPSHKARHILSGYLVKPETPKS